MQKTCGTIRNGMLSNKALMPSVLYLSTTFKFKPSWTGKSSAKERKRTTLAEEAEMINATWHPTWEAADLLLANLDFREHVHSLRQCHTEDMPFLHHHSPAADTNVDNLTRQGYQGSTDYLLRHWLTTQGHPMRNTA
eukprot:1147190-Pelagomonas_calceolata.AAC.5